MSTMRRRANKKYLRFSLSFSWITIITHRTSYIFALSNIGWCTFFRNHFRLVSDLTEASFRRVFRNSRPTKVVGVLMNSHWSVVNLHYQSSSTLFTTTVDFLYFGLEWESSFSSSLTFLTFQSCACL